MIRRKRRDVCLAFGLGDAGDPTGGSEATPGLRVIGAGYGAPTPAQYREGEGEGEGEPAEVGGDVGGCGDLPGQAL